jgi:hypothetical protein
MLISAHAILDLNCRQLASQQRCRSLLDRLLRRPSPPLTAPGAAYDDAEVTDGERDDIATVRALYLVSPHESGDDMPTSRHAHIATTPSGKTVIEEEATSFRWRRHPQLRLAPAMPVQERDARHAAVRGILAARDGDFDRAAELLRDAAAVPSIHFTEVPGFWSLSRRGMQAAIDAYEASGRLRDAAALSAQIRLRYRPRAVRPARLVPVMASRRVSVGD